MTLKELSEIDHPYYGSGYYEDEYETFDEFLEGNEGYDVDMNLCYRFDVRESETEEGEYTCEIITIQQRKGYCGGHFIRHFTEEDIPKLEEFLKPHMETLNKLLAPFN